MAGCPGSLCNLVALVALVALIALMALLAFMALMAIFYSHMVEDNLKTNFTGSTAFPMRSKQQQ